MPSPKPSKQAVNSAPFKPGKAISKQICDVVLGRVFNKSEQEVKGIFEIASNYVNVRSAKHTEPVRLSPLLGGRLMDTPSRMHLLSKPNI